MLGATENIRTKFCDDEERDVTNYKILSYKFLEILNSTKLQDKLYKIFLKNKQINWKNKKLIYIYIDLSELLISIRECFQSNHVWSNVL